MGIQYIKYSCPRCGQAFSNTKIAMVKAHGKCPACDAPLTINVKEALENTGETLLNGFIVFAAYFFVLWLVVTIAGIDVTKWIDALPGYWRIVAIVVAFFLVLMPGIMLSQWAVRSDVDRFLHSAKALAADRKKGAGRK